MKLAPKGDHVLIEMDSLERDFGATGLARPDIAREMPRWGTVRGVGQGRWIKRGHRDCFLPTTVAPGQRVMIPRASGTELTIAGRRHLQIREYGPEGNGDGGILAVEEDDA